MQIYASYNNFSISVSLNSTNRSLISLINDHDQWNRKQISSTFRMKQFTITNMHQWITHITLALYATESKDTNDIDNLFDSQSFFIYYYYYLLYINFDSLFWRYRNEGRRLILNDMNNPIESFMNVCQYTLKYKVKVKCSTIWWFRFCCQFKCLLNRTKQSSHPEYVIHFFSVDR